MAKLFYSVSGEGRGHATRVRTIVEELRPDNDITVFAPDLAYDLLEEVYRDTEVEVRKIPGLGFSYSSRNKLNYLKTAWEGLKSLRYFPGEIARLQKVIDKENPELLITDFEPILPRAAKRCGIPFISLDHQHFLVTYDLSSLPVSLRRYATLMAQVVRAYFQGEARTIVSSFYFPPVRPRYKNVEQIGVLLRPEILEARRENRNHIVVYLRRFASSSVLDALADCGCEVRLYGLGDLPSRGTLKFCKVDSYRFAEDLATSRALISTAGNQLVGEALYLNKPVFTAPEPGNYEQHINAHFLQQSGAGLATEMERITAESIRRFLDRFDGALSDKDQSRLSGNMDAVRLIREHLPASEDRSPFASEIEAVRENVA